MPIWLELVILSLFTYIAGVAIGWLLWGRSAAQDMVTPGDALGAPAEPQGEFDK
ncbi:hypothetical protein WAB17_09085 [Parerythrobacter aurantius]|uniref:hypothetical protein n=1 Tax=Parerythrobacter aurantius TaxID=3127706 RepID=UPI00325564E0